MTARGAVAVLVVFSALYVFGTNVRDVPPGPMLGAVVSVLALVALVRLVVGAS